MSSRRAGGQQRKLKKVEPLTVLPKGVRDDVNAALCLSSIQPAKPAKPEPRRKYLYSVKPKGGIRANERELESHTITDYI